MIKSVHPYHKHIFKWKHHMFKTDISVQFYLTSHLAKLEWSAHTQSTWQICTLTCPSDQQLSESFLAQTVEGWIKVKWVFPNIHIWDRFSNKMLDALHYVKWQLIIHSCLMGICLLPCQVQSQNHHPYSQSLKEPIFAWWHCQRIWLLCLGKGQ